ncbi:MAG: signal peptide peptidase SppA [Rikenellaceae bacterium]|nr:signal peptide peptidase SppA [Rikenellaceae bacterium]
MKNFLKMVLAVVFGLILTVVMLFMFLSGLMSSLTPSSASSSLPKSGVLAIDMSKIAIAEQSAEPDVMTMVQGGASISTVGLWQAVSAINKAAEDPAVKYIYIKADGASGGIATLQEFRKSLANFRSCGKAVISYIESPSTASYYIASVADKVYMTDAQGASSMVVGIGSRLVFLKDLLDKLGVNVQLIRHGKYKSAGEMYVKNAPSPENLEQNQAMIDAVWKSYASEIAESRNMSVEKLNSVIDNLELNKPEDFLSTGFVDALMSREELHSKLADLAVVDSYSKLKFFDLPSYIAAKLLPASKSGNKIAVVYADGEIIDGEDKSNVAGDRFASVLAKVRADSTVKAVVFRVNSPGGSVLASEKIKAEVELLREQKPVVASYGDYAASGGYWISNSCDKIFSNETTLTGSIGVFSMIPEFSKVMKDVVHVNMVSVSSNKHTDMYSLMRPFDDAERDYMQASVENIYDKFVNIVAEGRELESDYVDSIAQGRVWAGSDALKIGLVDEIGTLEDAINYASSLVGDPNSSSLNVVEYPKPMTSFEMLMEKLGQTSPDETVFSGTPFESVADVLNEWSRRVKKNPADVVFARIPYAIDIQ